MRTNPRQTGIKPLLCRWSTVCLLLLCTSTAEAVPEVDLDDVACALCHYEQGEAFAQSIHFNDGLLLCNDCHGGLPFEADNELAKAPGTGFIGKPQRPDVVRVCGTCHIAAARFFARGAHADLYNPQTPTCITCHSNHDVRAASLALMDSTCSQCHEPKSAALMSGLAIRLDLQKARAQLAAISMIVDSLATQDQNMTAAQPFITAAQVALTETDLSTHAWSASLAQQSLSVFDRELEGAQVHIAEHEEAVHRRHLAVASIWAFIAVNLVVLWAKRRQLLS